MSTSIVSEKKYWINEIFWSPQGEGARAGEMSIFVRFTGCNLRCQMESGPLSPGGFDCDTEFESGREYTLQALCSAIIDADDAICFSQDGKGTPWVVLTGGEPALQVDEEFIEAIHGIGYKIAIETNGTKELPPGIDWITVSPKTAEHTLKQLVATEVKYVRHGGQGIPKPRVKAQYYYLSPAFRADGTVDPHAFQTCFQLIRENPQWRVSEQQHKRWGVR